MVPVIYSLRDSACSGIRLYSKPPTENAKQTPAQSGASVPSVAPASRSSGTPGTSGFHLRVGLLSSKLLIFWAVSLTLRDPNWLVKPPGDTSKSFSLPETVAAGRGVSKLRITQTQSTEGTAILQ